MFSPQLDTIGIPTLGELPFICGKPDDRRSDMEDELDEIKDSMAEDDDDDEDSESGDNSIYIHLLHAVPMHVVGFGVNSARFVNSNRPIYRIKEIFK